MKIIKKHISLVFIIILICLTCFLDNYSQEASLINEFYEYNGGIIPKRIDASIFKNPQVECFTVSFTEWETYQYNDPKYLKKLETILKHLKDNGDVLPPHEGRDFYAGGRFLTFKLKNYGEYHMDLGNYPNGKTISCISSIDNKEYGIYDSEEKYEKMFTEVYEYVFFNAMKDHEEYEKSLSN